MKTLVELLIDGFNVNWKVFDLLECEDAHVNKCLLLMHSLHNDTGQVDTR